MRSFRQTFMVVYLLSLVFTATNALALPDGGTGAQSQPRLEILGMHDTGSVGLFLQSPELTRKLRVQSSTNVPIESLRAIVTPLRDKMGQLWDVSWDLDGRGKDTPVPVPALSSVPLTVMARLPTVGEYVGDIFLMYGKDPQRVRLTVTRGPAPLPVEILGIEPVMNTVEPVGTSKATLRFTVQETSGQGFLLAPVSVVGLSRVTKDAVPFQAPFELTDARPISLDGGASAPVQLILGGLEGAGEYKGTLRLFATGMQPVDREFRIYLKEHWLIALAWICLGVFTSLLLRWLHQGLRPRLEIQQTVLLLRREVEQEAQVMSQPPDEVERRVLSTVLSEMDRLVFQVGSGAVSTADVQMGLVRLQRKQELFPIWRSGRQRVRDLQPVIRKLFEERLKVAEEQLTQTTVPPENLVQILMDLEKLPSEVDQRVRDELRKAIVELLAEVETQVKEPESPLGAKLSSEVAPDLDAARKQLDANSADAVMLARATYDRARRNYLELISEHLASQLSEAIPSGFDEATWKDLRARVWLELNRARDRQTDIDAAFSAYERAHHIFLSSAARKLFDTVLVLLTGVEQSTDLSQEEKQALKGKLESQKQALEGVLTLVREENLREAALKYAEIQSNLQKLGSTVAVRGGDQKIAQATMGGIAALALPLSAMGPSITFPMPGTRPITLGSVSRLRMVIDLASFLFAAIVAGLLGVLALWEKDLTWGGWTARVTAFLWGLGLHQATYTTLTGLMNTLVGKKETS